MSGDPFEHLGFEAIQGGGETRGKGRIAAFDRLDQGAGDTQVTATPRGFLQVFDKGPAT
ncbi:hypothetical protein QNM99_10020 [Pseudomonas sp. PCH446]